MFGKENPSVKEGKVIILDYKTKKKIKNFLIIIKLIC